MIESVIQGEVAGGHVANRKKGDESKCKSVGLGKMQLSNAKYLWFSTAAVAGILIATLLAHWKARPVYAGTITVTNSGGTFSPVSRANLQRAFDAAQCGDEIQIEAGSFVRTGGKIVNIVKAGSEAIINFPYAHGFEVGEGINISGIEGFGSGLNGGNDVVAIQSETSVKIRAAGKATDGTYRGENANVYTTTIHFNYDPDKKSCAEGKEIVVTTTKKDWLPDADMRITPSYKPLIPTLQLVGHHFNNPLFAIHDEVNIIQCRLFQCLHVPVRLQYRYLIGCS